MATSIAGKLTHLISPKVSYSVEFSHIERSLPLTKPVLIKFGSRKLLTTVFPLCASSYLPNLQLQRSKSVASIRSVAGHANRNRLVTIKPRFAWSPSWRSPFPVPGHAPAISLQDLAKRTSTYLVSCPRRSLLAVFGKYQDRQARVCEADHTERFGLLAPPPEEISSPFFRPERQTDPNFASALAEPVEPFRVEEIEASEAAVESNPVYAARITDLPIFSRQEEKLEPKIVAEPQVPVLEAIQSVVVPLEDGSVFRPKITVVGIGGGGCNAVNKMISGKLPGVEFVVCNTDAQSLESSICESRVQLGEKLTSGFGAGSNPDVGRMAAQESVQNVLSHLHGSHMVFITAGLGGGTGTGAAPVIANACRNEGILTVAIVTMPFDFEGKRTRELAQTGLQKLQDQVDTVIVVPNQKLLSEEEHKSRPLLAAFGIVDEVLFRGIQGVTDLIVRPGLINTDFADLKSVMQSNSGRGLMGTGEAEGEDRAEKAAIAALEHPLLDDVDVSAARRVLVTISASSEVTMQEIDIISTTIQARVSAEALIIFGVTIAPDMGPRLRVSAVATDMAESASTFDQNHFGGASSSHNFNRKRPAKKESRPVSRSSNNKEEESGGFFRGWF